jgi:hypothetical protein
MVIGRQAHHANGTPLWWGYRHANGTVQVKPWFGDHADYIEDCRDNIFVQRVVPPFPAPSREAAFAHAERVLAEAEASGMPRRQLGQSVWHE